MGASTISGGTTTECLQGAHETLTVADAGGVEKGEAIGGDNLGVYLLQAGGQEIPPSF